jgi:4-amino-4-deoxy-L-arabinose transferase-like glycosyltransferase
MNRDTFLPAGIEAWWQRRATLLLLLVAAALLLPFLGMALFNTKGEPREAIVAVSMLQSGNWILPASNGDVIPYKPPLLAWCIALLSWLTGGEVTEYTSRMPSALALIALVVWTFRFYADNFAGRGRAWLASLVLLTSFEVYRAGMACRVDMLLTLFMVGAFYSLYNYWRKGLRGFPLTAVLMMSGAMLTKGPVGVLLPCLVVGLFMLLQNAGFWRTVGRLAGVALASLVLPLLWYVAAYRQGGDAFLSLVMEENLGRLTGTMSYDSHVNPWWYNFVTVILGMLPYTLLVVAGAVASLKLKALKSVRLNLRERWSRFRGLTPIEQFSCVCAVVVFVFYCIPKSKRSVYLLPIYPFLAWWVAGYALRLVEAGSRAVTLFSRIVGALAVAAYAGYVAVQCGMFPYGMLHGRHALDQAMMVTSLYNADAPFNWLCVSLSAIAAMAAFLLCRDSLKRTFAAAMATIALLYVAFSGTYQPGIVNAKSDKPIADAVAAVVPEGPIYAHVSADMLRFFTADFYTGDRIKEFDTFSPASGVMLIGVDDARTWLPAHASAYEFVLLKHFKNRSCDVRQEVLMLRFRALSAQNVNAAAKP